MSFFVHLMDAELPRNDGKGPIRGEQRANEPEREA